MESILGQPSQPSSAQEEQPAIQSDPATRQYWTVAGILAVITFCEFIAVYVKALKPIMAPLLVVLSLAKFLYVVQIFMHLKQDNKIFSWMFAVGVIMALVIGVALILVLHFGRGVV